MDFKLIVERQQKLDEKVVHYASRNKSKIKISMLAEIIELQEETMATHKTWKKKEHDRQAELEEYVDCLFFYAQLYLNGYITLTSKQANIEFGKTEDQYKLNENILNLIGCVLNNPDIMARRLGSIAKQLGYTNAEIMEAHRVKFVKNLERVTGEWANGEM